MISIGLEAIDNMTPVIRGAEAALSAFEGRATSTLTMLTRLGKEGAGIGAIGVGFIAIGTAAAKVEQQVANLNAVMRATPQQLRAIRDEGLALSQVTQFTEQSIISAQRLLAKAGANTPGVISQTPNVLNLASATQSDPTSAAQVYVAAQKTFQLSTKDSTNEVNILAQAVDSGVGSLGDYATAFKQIGPTAASANYDLRETSTAITDLMNAGLRGDTGTALKTFIQRIQHETPQARAEVERLGLSFYTQAGQLKPLSDIFDELRTKTIALTDEQKNYSLTQIFGQRGVRVADIATEQGSSGLAETAKHMDDIGSASDIAKEKLDTLEGSIHKLGSSINTLAVQGGQAVNPLVRSLVDMSTATANAISTASRANPLIPQLGVGSLAIAGLGIVNKKLTDRAEDRQDTKNAPILAADQVRTDAKLKQDLAISASNRKLNEELVDSNTKYTESFLANMEKQRLAIDQVIEEELRRRQLAEQTAIIDNNKALADFDTRAEYEHRRLDLTAVQNAPTGGKGIAVTGASAAEHTRLAERQALDREELETLQANNELFVPRYNNIADQRIDDQIKKEEANTIRLNDALMVEAAKRDAGLKAASEASIANAQSTYGQQIFQTDTMLAGRSGKVVPKTSGGQVVGGVTVAAEDIALDATLATKAKGLIGTAGSAIGKIAMPVLIVITAKELILDPITKALTQEFVNKQVPTINLDVVTPDPNQRKQEIQREIDQQEGIRNEYMQKRKNQSGFDRLINLQGPLGLPTQDKDFAGVIDKANAQLKSLYADLASTNSQIASLPQQAVSKETDRLQSAVQDVRDGTKTVDEAIDSMRTLFDPSDDPLHPEQVLLEVDYLRKMGVEEKNVIAFQNLITSSINQSADARKQELAAIEATNAATREGVAAQIEDAKKVIPQGASSQDVLAGIFGITSEGQKASAAAVSAAKKDISDLSQAWNQAAQAINAVDISKGAAGLADANEGLVKARDELNRLGLSQSNLNSLTDITKIFKDIADQEQKADSAMNGYLLTLNHTSDAMKNIGTLKGQFLDALNAAQDRVLRGTNSQSDLAFIKQAPSIIGTLDQQGRNVSQGSTEDLLNIAKNLPNFTQQVNDFNRAVKDAGGGQNIILKVQAETLAAKQDIKTITDGKYSATIDVGLTFNGLSAALGNISGLPPIFRQILGLDEGLPVGSASSSRKTTATSGGSSDMQRGIPGGTWNQYHSLSQPDYMDIVKSGSIPGKTSPFEDPSFYGAVLRAAQENGVDPRALLAFTKSENHNATDIGAGQLAAKNYGGLKYVGQPLAHQGTEVPIDEQGPGKPKYYAAFDTIDDFFDTLAQNLTTGQYADAYKKGDLAAVSRMYVGSDEPTRVNDYNTYASKYPAAGDDTGFGGDAGGGALIDGKANSIRQQIVQKALSDVDIDRMVAYCEQWVEETIQAVTGRRGAVGVKQEDANTALATAQKMNLVTNNPQPGDLVYYGDANKGHVAIYMGGGKQVSTWDKGAFPGNTGPDHSSGTGAANAKIHTEDVGPGAIYVSIPGLPDATKGERSPAQGKSGTIQAVNQQILNGTGTQNKPDAPILPNVQKELDAVSKQFQNMAAVDITNVINATNSLDGAFTKLAQHNLASAGGFVNGQGPSTPSEQTALNNEQLREGLVIEQAYAVVVNDIANGKTDITDDEQKLLAVSGALGPMLVAELDTRNKIAIVARQTKLDQDALTGLEATHNADLKARATTDENESRRRTREQWGQQDYETNQQFLKNLATWKREDDRQRITDKYDAEKKGLDDTWTKRSRQLEDEQRLLDFQGTSQKAALDQQLVDMDKAHKLTTANMQATEQLLRGQTTGGGDRNARNNAKEVLAIQMDYDKRQNDAYTKSRQSVQDAIDAQSRLVSLERYNFETQKLAETRKHEDDLKKIADAQTADNKKWANEDKLRTRTETMTQMFDQIAQQNKARGYQQDDWNLADLRKKTDDKYESDKAALTFKITNEQEQSKLLDDVLSKTLAVEQAWSRTADSAGSIVSGGAAHDSGQGGGSTGTFVRRLGGYASGTSSATAGLWAIAEKEPEIVAKGNEKIMPLSEYLGTASSNSGGDTTIHNHLHFDSGMEAIFDAEGMARMKQVAQEETARMLRADRKKTLGSGSSTGARRRTS